MFKSVCGCVCVCACVCVCVCEGFLIFVTFGFVYNNSISFISTLIQSPPTVKG